MSKKYLHIMLIAALFVLSFTTQSFALKVKNDLAIKMLHFDTAQPQTTTFTNGLSVTYDNFKPMWVMGSTNKATLDNCIYQIKGLLNVQHTLGILYFTVSFSNESDKILAIKWGQSQLTFGSWTGLPCLDGIKTIDANRPNALPDTILTPKQKVTRAVFMPPQFIKSYRGGFWQDNWCYYRLDNSLNATLALKVCDADGKETYVAAVSPKIIISSEDLDTLKNPPKEHDFKSIDSTSEE